ncbi:recombinase family protein [Paeniglutamicibacter kerguelensis]|uniref:DNA invertase Pin-like site-specific DNA recombinase n=1 Tax=Paeniglutamicibacter kerguelensis TaxID=254788 RepID=A0ABS4XIZ1_9MICC|nr:recombinase family protein [Paeniglutamicibacter kerguelensis]MBP2388427.1 DNA invertase Pin-like site-specific DNA recombinase [Paeniglutamicibacter kerguelensis]
MSPHLVGYARVSTNSQDLSSQQAGLKALGVPDELVYVDHGLTGRNRERPGLQQALAACRAGDTLVVTKLDRLARSLPDARDIVEDLTKRNIRLSLGGSIHDPTDPVGKLLFNVLAMVAEFESDLIRARTREGMQIAKAKGKLRGKQPKLSPAQEKHLVTLHQGGQHTSAEIAELFGVARSTVYRIIQRSP